MMLAYGCVKLSIVAFYRRLFVVNSNTPFNIATKVMGVIIIGWTIAFFLMVVFACGTHFSANWGSTPSQLEFCPIGFTSEYGLVISDLIIDVVIFFLPLPLVSHDAGRLPQHHLCGR